MTDQPNDKWEERFRSALVAHGQRPTRQRAAIYRFLSSVTSHPTAEEVYLAVKPEIPNVSLATVYKGLETLAACGLAQKLTYADGSARYDANCEPHYHLRCARTGRVADVPVPFDPHLLDKIDGRLADRLHAMGFSLAGYRLDLIGEFRGSAAEAGA